jgi:hypothetical protein
MKTNLKINFLIIVHYNIEKKILAGGGFDPPTFEL